MYEVWVLSRFNPADSGGWHRYGTATKYYEIARGRAERLRDTHKVAIHDVTNGGVLILD